MEYIRKFEKYREHFWMEEKWVLLFYPTIKSFAYIVAFLLYTSFYNIIKIIPNK